MILLLAAVLGSWAQAGPARSHEPLEEAVAQAGRLVRDSGEDRRQAIPEGGSVVMQDPYSGSFLLRVNEATVRSMNGGRLLLLDFGLNGSAEIRLGPRGSSNIDGGILQLTDANGDEIKVTLLGDPAVLVTNARYRRAARILSRRGRLLMDIALPSSSARLRIQP